MPTPSRIYLSDHTLDINTRRVNVEQFDFNDVADYCRALTAGREYQFDALKRLLIYLWGGRYQNLRELAQENYRKKSQIQQRFHSEEHFLRMLPMPEQLSGVCHLATGTGKSYVMIGLSILSILLGKTKRVLVLGPSSTVIESGLREKFKEYLYGEKAAELRQHLPPALRYKAVKLLTCNDPIEDDSIVIENINAVYQRDRNAIGDLLKRQDIGELLVLSDEVHHAYSHLDFSGDVVNYDFEEGAEGKGEDREERLWMRFLREEKRITRHIGFTGTPYNQDDYFVDVLFSYSIKDALEGKIIKKINPIIHTEMDDGGKDLTLYQKFEQILKTHDENRADYAYVRNGRRQVKPITIFINRTQASAEKNSEEFISVLADYLAGRSSEFRALPRATQLERARAQVICVISKNDDAETQRKLDLIEEADATKEGGLVEYIFAVNKLSEGWDVDNVFQIVPMEEKVFNSKLLISQVLGRGLRLPRRISAVEILQRYPMVTITNHERFAEHITQLLDQVTECETRFHSHVLPEGAQERSQFNFNLFNLEYIPTERVEERTEGESAPSGSRKLTLTPSPDKLGLKVTYLEGTRQFQLTKEFVTFDQMVLDVERRFQNTQFEQTKFDFGFGAVIDHVPSREDIEQVIRQAMQQAGIEGDKLSIENKKQIEIFFNSFLPRGSGRVVRAQLAGRVVGISTKAARDSSVRSGALDHDAAVFVSEDWERELDEDNKFVVKVVQGTGPQQSVFMLHEAVATYNAEFIRALVPFRNLFAVNTSLFRTPQDLVILSHEPERQFLFRLIENGTFLDGWIKSPDTDFYSLDYEYWRKGRDRVRRSFNPDFFIFVKLDRYMERLGADVAPTAKARLIELQNLGIEELVFVVEIKSDEDESEETEAKLDFGKQHFARVNQRLRETNPIDLQPEFRSSSNQLYSFNLLRPENFNSWCGRVSTGLIVFDASLPVDRVDSTINEETNSEPDT